MSLKTRITLTLKQKSEVIEQLRSGSSLTSLAKRYNVAKSTICAINKQSEKILKCINDTYSGPGKRKTLRLSNMPKMEKALFRWFLQLRNKHYPVTGPMIKEQAKILHSKINENQSEFNASDGWLQRFKTRYGVRLKVTEEKQSSQPDLEDTFKRKLQERISELGLSSDQLYNADQSGLFWKLLPEAIEASPFEKNREESKIEKRSINFLGCANRTGLHKLKLLVIGNIKNSSALENFNYIVDYRNSKSSLITATIIKDWFHQLFVPQVTAFLQKRGLPVKALLLIDRAPLLSENELKTDDGCVSTIFFPSNVKPVVEPMDQTTKEIPKLCNRNSLLASIPKKQSDEITLRDAVIYLESAWNRIETDIIAKCWENILAEKKENSQSENAFEFVHIKSEIECTVDTQEWNEGYVTEDNNISSHEESDNEKIMPSEAVQILSKALKWAKSEMVSQNDLSVLRRLREQAKKQLNGVFH